MKADKNKVVAVSYELEVEGKIADKSAEGQPLEYIQGTGMLLPKFEAAVDGKEPGETFDFVLSPEDGYGEYNPDYAFDIPKASFEVDGKLREDLLVVGLTIPMLNSAGHVVQGTIKEIKEAQAEKTKTKEIRQNLEKTKEEIAQKAKEAAEEKKKEEGEVVLKVGDTVCIEEMQVVGEILTISDTDATILFDSVRLRTSPDKLRKVSRAEARKAQRNWQKGIAADLSEKAEHFDLTLDVRGHRAEEALDLVDKYLDEAKLLSIKEVSILHGKGNGILRKLIREKLSHMREVERFCDASLETGGTGITRVYFR